MLHSSTSVGFPLHVPPFSSATNFTRVFVRVPVPQLFEHSPWIHSSHWQWMAAIQWLYIYVSSYITIKLWYFILKCQPIDNLPGQLWVLQGSSTAFSPSHLPPFSASDFFVLVFVLVPPPHGFEHIPSSQSFHSQSIAVASFWLVIGWLRKRISVDA